jgi:hypothetical protein
MVVTLVHGVQPAHHLGPGAAEVPAAFGPYLQYRRVVIRCRQPDRISLPKHCAFIGGLWA